MLFKLFILICVYLTLNTVDNLNGEILKDAIGKSDVIMQIDMIEYPPINKKPSEYPFSCIVTPMKEDKAHSEGILRYTVPISSISEKENSKSPECSIDDVPWSISFGKWEYSGNGKKITMLKYFAYLDRDVTHTKWSCDVMLDLIIISHKLDAKSYEESFESQFNSTDNGWGYYKYIEWNELVDPDNGYVKDGDITLEAHIKPFCAYMDSKKETKYAENNKYRFDYEYYPKIDGWLKHNDVPATWEEARLRCYLEGAKLASPLNDAMLKIMNTNIHNDTWTGVHATYSKGDYFSLGGVSLLRMPVRWAPGEPDNRDNLENCTVLQNRGALASASCNDQFPYFCYKKKTSSVMNFCGTLDPNYTYGYKAYNCYKFHNRAQTWQRAFMTCAAEGGHLAIMNTPAKTQYLKEMFAKYPKEKIYGADTSDKNYAFIGIHEWDEAGMWMTIQDDPLDSLIEEGVVAWAKGQPAALSPDGRRQSCGALTRDARLSALSCDALAPFICEKAPDSLVPKKTTEKSSTA